MSVWEFETVAEFKLMIKSAQRIPVGIQTLILGGVVMTSGSLADWGHAGFGHEWDSTTRTAIGACEAAIDHQWEVA